MDEPLTLCFLHCVGQTGNGEQQFNQRPSLAPPHICDGQIVALGLARRMKTAAEAVNEGGHCFVFQ